jgi:hypothetical protein
MGSTTSAPQFPQTVMLKVLYQIDTCNRAKMLHLPTYQRLTSGSWGMLPLAVVTDRTFNIASLYISVRAASEAQYGCEPARSQDIVGVRDYECKIACLHMLAVRSQTSQHHFVFFSNSVYTSQAVNSAGGTCKVAVYAFTRPHSNESPIFYFSADS